MAFPLVVLGTLALFSGGIGWVGAPGSQWFEHRVNDTTLVKNLMTESGLATAETKALFAKQFVHQPGGHGEAVGGGEVGKAYGEAWHHAHGTVFAFSLLASPTMIALAYFFFMKKRGRDYVGGSALLSTGRTFLENLWYVDAAIIKGFVPQVAKFFRFVFSIDKHVVDGLVNGAAWIVERISFASGRADYLGVDGAVRGTGAAMLEGGDAARRMVTGKINDYVLYTVFGLAALVLVVVLFGN
jgi:hypothetical protein